MIPLIVAFFHALLWDKTWASHRLRAAIGLLATSGAAYAGQIGEEFHSPGIAKYVRVAAFACSVMVAAHGSRKKRTPAEVKA